MLKTLTVMSTCNISSSEPYLNECRRCHLKFDPRLKQLTSFWWKHICTHVESTVMSTCNIFSSEPYLNECRRCHLKFDPRLTFYKLLIKTYTLGTHVENTVMSTCSLLQWSSPRSPPCTAAAAPRGCSSAWSSRSRRRTRGPSSPTCAPSAAASSPCSTSAPAAAPSRWSRRSSSWGPRTQASPWGLGVACDIWWKYRYAG